MSTNDVRTHTGPSFSDSGENGEVTSPSSSKAAVPRQTYLDVPPFRPSRPSLDSTYSELSELSFHPNELQSHHALFRSVSREGADHHPPRSRIGAALHSFYITNYGAMLVVLAQLFGAGMNVSTQLLETEGSHGKPMHPFQILFARQSITAFLCSAYAIYTKSVPDFPLGPRGVRWLLVSRGIFGFFGVFGMYFSLLYLPLSEATVLTFLSPILTCYLCSFVVRGETFTRQQQLAGFVSLIGVIFIAQPASLFSSSTTPPPQPPNPAINQRSNSTTTADSHQQPQQPTPEQHLAAIGIAMLGVVGSTGAMTSIRAIGTRAHPFISINYFSTWCAIVSLVALIVFPDVKFRLPGNITEWSLLASLGLCGFIMQFLLTAGLAYGGPGNTHVSGSQGHDESKRKAEDVESNDSSAADFRNYELVSQAEAHGEGRVPPAMPAKPKLSGSGTRATSMVYTQMLFALAADKLVFGVTPSTMSWVGSVLILAGAIWVASARSSVSKGNNADINGDVGEATNGLNMLNMQRQGKHYEVAGETVGLVHDQDDDENSGNDLHHRQLGGSDDILTDTPQAGLSRVESFEMHELRSEP
ncbi:hypothetical protein HRR83_002115 [Exophiala dermatitidis]|uniref:EamA domain-containing protein n=1 Tax=Exophiala dermatitidis TaxID=5970 RepID=A0AAN6EYH5_EXODE|nr:hypothetical protein HRR75_002013 [Exophiala dermatitidis]KAJ4523997.1 hypothetical protein HRR74_002192 [Exophiala dermatitidis]KAJ4525733.1 hypothetical protein HRR73_002465 [Exophiala dermatitidis]KAJ4537059.1 hypothetical protein HRR76_005076 [Exophiala dermatitidis]KAJ4555343.1 hypothetical protein HRR77_001279 [Exophiala dermatitidis]